MTIASILCAGLAMADSSASKEILQQKVKLFEMYMASATVGRIEEAGEPDAKFALQDARDIFRAASEALAQGNLDRAATGLDEALRKISVVTAASNKRPNVSADDQKARFLQLQGQVASYLAALERDAGTGVDAQALTADRAKLEQMMSAAEAYARGGRHDLASATLSEAYRYAVARIASWRKGETAVSRLHFANAEQEYAYELKRNKSYELLVEIMLSERETPTAGFSGLVEKESKENKLLRHSAMQAAERGDFSSAIAEMEQATGHLIRVLRAGGLPVFE